MWDVARREGEGKIRIRIRALSARYTFGRQIVFVHCSGRLAPDFTLRRHKRFEIDDGRGMCDL